MAESYPRPAEPDGCSCHLRPVDPPVPVVGYVTPVTHSRPATKAEAEAEANRQAGGILARARAQL